MTHQHQTGPTAPHTTAPQATASQPPSTVLQFKPGVPGVGITALTGVRDVIHSTLQAGKLGAALRGNLLSLRAGEVDEDGPVIPGDSKWGTGNLKGPSDGLLLTEGGVYAWVMIQLSQEDLEAQAELTLSVALKSRSPYVQSVEVYNQTWSSDQRVVSVHLHTPDHLLHAETMTAITGRDVEIVQDNREATRRSYVYERGAFRGLIEVSNSGRFGETCALYPAIGVTVNELQVMVTGDS
ncbi:hypothetical protein ACMT4L_03120 [Deinococcus sp. A31D244]|uniref:hypothetical protein n=1 Tax=Deinococcus sp. A31D244 TaxID=3397675 RepID=UPI0039E0E7D6